ncbi:hypothetical protein VAR608DRAFT_2793 [Variovorax sp. HW608]|nr:hypothetical protein [Variovorax sp. HW608]SCK32183.1 hypothetical protein VAR608DRAFT_2793 [Variovorax sp. HW608]
MRKLWFALLFFAGGMAHELRHPLSCQAISVRQGTDPRQRKRGP